MTYRYKGDPNGATLDRKARCAVRGDLMQAGVHYDPERTTTYMAEKTSVRSLLAIAAFHRWPSEHFDITSAYLHEKNDNHRPVYIKQHPRFDGTFKHPRRVGILVGNLYGSPPASHIYFTVLVRHLKNNGFLQAQSDPCVFTRITGNQHTLIAVSMDDFLVLANTKALITQTYNSLNQKYNIKRLGAPSKYINWKITTSTNGTIHISQSHVIESILKKTQMSSCNPKPSPNPEKINRDLELTSPTLNPSESSKFRTIIGELRYLADSTRFDIHHITNRLAAAMQKPTQYHPQLLEWLLRYLRGNTEYGITYHPCNNSRDITVLQTFSDADFANSADRKSYTGIVQTLHCSPVTWTSSKQSVVALSTCEAEYLAASTATQQALWLRCLLIDIHHPQTNPTPHHIDNLFAILVAKSASPTKRRKLIDTKHHHLRDNTEKGQVSITRIPSTSNPADMFTKPLGKHIFNLFSQLLNLVPSQKVSSAPPGTA